MRILRILSLSVSQSLCFFVTHKPCGFRVRVVRVISSATNFLTRKPFVNCSAWKAGEFASQFQVRQPSHQEIVNRADRHAEARGELLFVFVLRLTDSAWTGVRGKAFVHGK